MLTGLELGFRCMWCVLLRCGDNVCGSRNRKTNCKIDWITEGLDARLVESYAIKKQR